MKIKYLLDENLPPLYIENLIFIALAAEENEFQDRIIHIPLR
jgi:hypothetical protein